MASFLVTRSYYLSFLVTVVLVPPTLASAQGAVDRVRLERGSEGGDVLEMSPLEVTISRGSTGNKKIPVNQIRSIVFQDEPNDLTQARVIANSGGYETALEMLSRIDAQDIQRTYIQQDVKFYRALCAAKLALGGNGKVSEAGREVMTFLRDNRDNYHHLEAVEVLGDLFAAAQSYANAEEQYGLLARSPWPEYQARAALLVGRVLQAQGKHAEAIRQFDEALRLSGSDDAGKSQRLSATLEKAISLSQSGELDRGVESIESVIRDANPEEQELNARAYNALGDCYRQANQTEDALYAYLHVDVLYNSVPDAHAEALAQLATLWESIGQNGRAREARQTLREQYAASTWAKELEKN